MRPLTWSTSYLLRLPRGISISTSNSTLTPSVGRGDGPAKISLSQMARNRLAMTAVVAIMTVLAAAAGVGGYAATEAGRGQTPTQATGSAAPSAGPTAAAGTPSA